MKTPKGQLSHIDLGGSFYCVWACRGKAAVILGSEDLGLCYLLLDVEFSEPLLHQVR